MPLRQISAGGGGIEEDVFTSATDLTLVPASSDVDVPAPLDTPDLHDPFSDGDLPTSGDLEDEERLLMMTDSDSGRLLGTPVQDAPDLLMPVSPATVGEDEKVPARVRFSKEEDM